MDTYSAEYRGYRLRRNVAQTAIIAVDIESGAVFNGEWDSSVEAKTALDIYIDRGGKHAADYTAAQTFAPGDRVELHPGCDLWMRGAKFATVTRANSSVVWVTVDNLTFKPQRWFHRESLRHVR